MLKNYPKKPRQNQIDYAHDLSMKNQEYAKAETNNYKKMVEKIN